MPETRTLPHDPYITAIVDALTEAGLEPADSWTSDADTRGVYCYLNAVITLDPDTSGLPKETWPHGLVLIWEWHTGLDDYDTERGPSWQWACGVDSHGQTEQPDSLPVPGWVAPAMLAATVATLAHAGKATPMGSLWHPHLIAPVEAAIEQWAAEEAK